MKKLNPETYKCKNCCGQVRPTEYRAEVKYKGHSKGFGQIYMCSNPECEASYIAVKGEWFEKILKPIEPLKEFKEK